MLLEVTEGKDDVRSWPSALEEVWPWTNESSCCISPDSRCSYCSLHCSFAPQSKWEINLLWSAAVYPSEKVRLLPVNTESSWTKCTSKLSIWSHAVFGGLLSAGGLDTAQFKSEQP